MKKWHRPSKGFVCLVGLLLLFALPALAQKKQKGREEEAAYKEVVKQRADKIAETLNIADEEKLSKVRDMIAEQYFTLNTIQSKRDEQLTSVNTKSNSKAESRAKDIKSTADKKISKLHKEYIIKLSSQLSADQIEQVKDGMTYNVVPLTYRNYLLMLPYLTNEQRTKIKTFLVEAREHAMDGGSSKEKHAWFGKYKGKITNYLASQGYDLKKEGDNWAKRRNIKSDALEIVESNRVVGALNLTDDSKKEDLRNLIAHQYQTIQEIQQERDAKMKATGQLSKSKEEIDKEAADIWAKYQVQLGSQREMFFQQLSAFADSSQVETVKNEMTDNRLQQEYSHFMALLPNLNDGQKKQVYAYLLEARDNAMNVLKEEDRLKWFIKFRGRANNYLSREGYNLRKATEDLERKLLVEKKGHE
ncbi:DUF3826 domain-containing protein [Pontibacter sp. 13R65]|uniref:DUF3826 domain-containing protein n=1 Tax=Pontibacter sp. 13R65 TaxID=3127458 RepID=UPI00301C3781